MPYNKDAYRVVRQEFERRREEAKTTSDSRRARLEREIEGLAELDAALARLGPRIYSAALEPDFADDPEGKIEKLRSETAALTDLRAAMLKTAGYPEDYDRIRYECEECGDTGTARDFRMCACFRRALAVKSLELSGIGSRLLAEQSFDSFDLSYYEEKTSKGNALTDREQMSRILAAAKDYASAFNDQRGFRRNLLFVGGTGLGKTHLATAIAKRVVESGNDVVYLSAQRLFGAFEKNYFGKMNSYDRDDTDWGTERIFNCDLLIIDDLGSESKNKFTVSTLYDLVNTRIADERAMIISTNLTEAALRAEYNDRIASRVFGEFRIWTFAGGDIRNLKNKREVRG